MAWIVLLPLLLTVGAATGENAEIRWDTPTTIAPASSLTQQIGAGRITLDLTKVDYVDPEGEYQIDDMHLAVGAGQVTVVVPEDVNVQFYGTVAAGDILVDNVASQDSSSTSRFGPIERLNRTFGSGDAPQIIVNVTLGAGQILVVQAPTEAGE